jgi:Secretion system C-terminal sorting domain
LIYGDYYGTISYMENTGNAKNPSFGAIQTNPFNLQPENNILLLTAADIDDDGDQDLLINAYDSTNVIWNFYYFQNGFPVGISEPVNNALIKVLPNPANEFVDIQFQTEGIKNDYTIALYDNSGKLLLSETVKRDEPQSYKRITIQQLPPGIYLLKVNDGENNIVEKIIKQ